MSLNMLLFSIIVVFIVSAAIALAVKDYKKRKGFEDLEKMWKYHR